jgi:hypothetical protein
MPLDCLHPSHVHMPLLYSDRLIVKGNVNGWMIGQLD